MSSVMSLFSLCSVEGCGRYVNEMLLIVCFLQMHVYVEGHLNVIGGGRGGEIHRTHTHMYLKPCSKEEQQPR